MHPIRLQIAPLSLQEPSPLSIHCVTGFNALVFAFSYLLAELLHFFSDSVNGLSTYLSDPLPNEHSSIRTHWYLAKATGKAT